MSCQRPNYIDVYFSRVSHYGETFAEQVKNKGERHFDKILAQSPHKVSLSVERGLYFDGVILEDKDSESEKIMKLNVANNIPIRVGDMINWFDDGCLEKWLIVSKKKKVNGPYQTFSILKCNYLLKWIDELGHLQCSWAYFVSSLDSKIKENFRTWHNLITAQPNKYAEVIMPRHNISRSNTFIVEDEAWDVVEYDWSSVKGIMYISLTEEKVNYIYDDTENNVADTDTLANYEVVLPQTPQTFLVGEPINLAYVITKDGKPFHAEVNITSLDKSVIKYVNKELMAVGEGTATLEIQLVDFPQIVLPISVEVGAQPSGFSAFIEGNDEIRLDFEATYQLKGTEEINEDVEFSIISGADLAFISSSLGDTCVIRSNDDNKLGEVTLCAAYNGETYTKTINIVPLW